jgi:triphosphoribosyl-dephospho-CoA synthase
MNMIELGHVAASEIERAFIDACLLDVMALKPGNVGAHAPGHGMQAVDFVHSAERAASAITQAADSVGERIQRAIIATRAVASGNTNLGIVLLAAPMVHAAARCAPPRQREGFARELRAVLATLTVADAELAFAAIRLANPGGLGTSARHDVQRPAEVTLLDAMREAAERDMIARQYAEGYAAIIETGLARLDAARMRGRDLRWATTETYLAFLARYPDSHIARKFGWDEAQSVRQAASEFDRAAGEALHLHTLHAPLMEWDAALKARGLNPGTSADLTVATLCFSFLCEAEVKE